MMAVIMNNHEAMQKSKVAASPAVAASSSGLKSENIFGMMATYLNQGLGKALIPKVDAVFGFEIQGKKGGPVDLIYEIDLKNGQGHTKRGKPAKPDATFTMTDEDFEAVCLGKLNPQIAFMQGKMKIKGNMAKASKFTPELFPPPTPENLTKFAPTKL
jgi:3-hydroxyacyl-CoA dehydrogenase/3a,7a,12a-trihydroxy-5b-cholest-24-enoyl-CoA hydratase